MITMRIDETLIIIIIYFIVAKIYVELLIKLTKFLLLSLFKE